MFCFQLKLECHCSLTFFPLGKSARKPNVVHGKPWSKHLGFRNTIHNNRQRDKWNTTYRLYTNNRRSKHKSTGAISCNNIKINCLSFILLSVIICKAAWKRKMIKCDLCNDYDVLCNLLARSVCMWVCHVCIEERILTACGKKGLCVV